jgi:hypothetical protein
MLSKSNLARRIYTVFLGLYPSGFRKAFADEMLVVFAEAAVEARRRGATAMVGLAWRELSGLLIGAVSEHWQALSRKELMMNETLEIDAGSGTAQVDMGSRYDPGSWRAALMAGLPHFLMGCFFATLTIVTAYEFASSRQNLADIIGIALAVLFAVLVGVILLVARRASWPSWVASWYPYAGILVMLPLLWLLQRIDQSAPLRYLMLISPVTLALVLYLVARRNRLKVVLIALPVMTLLWGVFLEFFTPEVDLILNLWGWTLTAVVAVAIVRLDNWRLGVWLFLALSLLISLTAAVAFVYWNNIPPEHAPDRTIYEVIRFMVPPFLTFSILVLGPLLVWTLWELGQRSGPMGVPGFQFIFWGLLVVMVCFLGAVFLRDGGNYVLVYRFRDTGLSWLVTGAALGGYAAIFGALMLGTAAVINKALSSRTTTILLVAVPLMLPLVFSIIYHNISGMASWLLVPLRDFPFVIGTTIMLGWVLLGAWLVTRRYWNVEVRNP